MRRLVFLGLGLVLLIPLSVVGAEVPPTIPHPPINGQNGYYIGLMDLNTRTGLWRAPYHHELLYEPNTGWRNGDRLAYHCAYGPLFDNGVIVGRFIFRDLTHGVEGGSYIQVNDTWMEEPNAPQDTAGGPSRYMDGTPNTTGQQTPWADCPQDVGVAYEPSTVDEDPIIAFWNDGEVIEIRDYRNVVPAAGVTFEEIAPITEPFQMETSRGLHWVNDRRTVIARFNGLPVVGVYYDGLGTGSVIGSAAEEPGDGQPNPDDCNAVISMSQGAQVYSGSQAGASDPDPSELEAATGEEWMLLFKGGAPLKQWKSQLTWDSLSERHRCGTDAEIDRVLFIFDPRGSSAPFTDDLAVVEGIMADRYPNAVIDVALLVGGKAAGSHVVCTITQFGEVRTVIASQTHFNSIGLMTMANAGPDLDIPCSGYADRIGHLNDAGALEAQSQVAAFYSEG